MKQIRQICSCRCGLRDTIVGNECVDKDVIVWKGLLRVACAGVLAGCASSLGLGKGRTAWSVRVCFSKVPKLLHPWIMQLTPASSDKNQPGKLCRQRCADSCFRAAALARSSHASHGQFSS